MNPVEEAKRAILWAYKRDPSMDRVHLAFQESPEVIICLIQDTLEEEAARQIPT